MKQIWHHYLKWEDFKSGMWRKAPKEDEAVLLNEAIQFTGNHVIYGMAMQRVISEWRFSCEHNLTNEAINKRAWIGHAACQLEKNLPEYIVRQAWGLLTNEQRYFANKEADKAIAKWIQIRDEKKKSNQLSLW